ncbi:RNA-guided endonuclease InsQ/TnpB family protein [Calothrix sp. CCY 0018]|uniref:RNA-guided endonuclease InsQ/TnpB family protein n=1 Tax=Calothrix sp. CCY 0018 TaxID=3103864 RepID=UPI0039C73616
MKARYRYRVYPTNSQKVALSQLFGCVRVVWNDALAFCVDSYKKGIAKLGNSELQKIFITAAKKKEERHWLKDVSNIPLQQSLNDLEKAYSNFFSSCKGNRKGKPVKPPKFKKRKARQSARFRKGGFKIYPHFVSLAKIGKLKIVWSRKLPSEASSVTVIKDAADRYFVSFVVEVQPDILPLTPNTVGIDLGIATFATLDSGEKIHAPKPLKKRIQRLRKLSKKLSKKTAGSNRYERTRKIRAKFYAKLKDTRTDFLHKLSTRLIRENQTIVLEDLNVSGLVKNRKLSRAITDLGWRQFRAYLEAKAEKFGRECRVINRWEPTTQRCSYCGGIGGKKDLSVREWQCLFCNAFHDRDINAAANIKVAGGHPETRNGRGGKCKTSVKEAASSETSTYPTPRQLDLYG